MSNQIFRLKKQLCGDNILHSMCSVQTIVMPGAMGHLMCKDLNSIDRYYGRFEDVRNIYTLLKGCLSDPADWEID
eukprot:COSAG01_NODE_9215_length_2516_cov_1.788581_2_plen_75_part_00